MQYTFKAKNTTVTDALKEKATQKIDKLQKFLPENTNIVVTFSVIKLSHTIEVTINLPKRVLRAEVTSSDMYASIDEVVDKLEKQMVKYRSRLRDKSRRDNSFNDELSAFNLQSDEAEEDGKININKTKKFAIKPMDPEEAVMEMELVSHSFFVFRNSSTDEVNVVYKRKDNSYGLIEPEL